MVPDCGKRTPAVEKLTNDALITRSRLKNAVRVVEIGLKNVDRSFRYKIGKSSEIVLWLNRPPCRKGS